MAQTIVTYCMPTRLACSCVPNAGVILCITPSLVRQLDCPVSEHPGVSIIKGEDPTLRGFIYGNLDTVYRFPNTCGGGEIYRYGISYDDDQIVAGRRLTDKDISGVVCEGCLSNYILDNVGEPVTLDERTPGFLTLRNQSGCEFTFARGWTELTQDTNTGELTVTYPNGDTQIIDLSGLTVGCAAVVNCETPVTVIDTQTVNLTNSGISTHTVQADVKISADAMNQLQVRPDGLFAVATLSSPASSDHLVDNGNRTFTHTAADGAQVSFCQGVASIVSNDQAGKGIGDGFMIKSASVADCVLYLRSAPEHTSFQVSGAGNYTRSTPTDISTIGISYDGPTLPAVINNPSPYRALIAVGAYDNAKSVEFRQGWAGVIDTAETWASPTGTFRGVIRTHREVIANIPAGGSTVVGPYILSIQTNSGAANSAWYDGAALLVIHCTTV